MSIKDETLFSVFVILQVKSTPTFPLQYYSFKWKLLHKVPNFHVLLQSCVVLLLISVSFKDAILQSFLVVQILVEVYFHNLQVANLKQK